MKGSQDAVTAFHLRFGFPVGKALSHEDSRSASRDLLALATEVSRFAEATLDKALSSSQSEDADDRLYRAHLILEEASEVLAALAERNEIELADALGDLIYVVLGTAATYDIPLMEVFDEVHRSNMTKSRSKKDPRMKAGKKRSAYSPPDIKQAIQAGRDRQAVSERNSR